MIVITWKTLPLLVLTLLKLASTQQNGEMRLMDGLSSNCGRVEIFYDNEWGTICDENWQEINANVVCKQLGYERALTFSNYTDIGFPDYGSGEEGPMLELNCPPLANSISECTHNGWSVHNCTNDNHLRVCCGPNPSHLPVRLTCPPCSDSKFCKTFPDKHHPAQTDCRRQLAVVGIVEVQIDGVWGPISADGWDANEANVVCGQLGYPKSFPFRRSAPPTLDEVWPQYSELTTMNSCQENHSQELQQLSQSFSYTFIQGLECSGTESQLLNCNMSSVGSQPNPTQSVAAVKCGFRSNYECLPDHKKIVRLRAGAVKWAGRVEIYKNGKWSTVCDDAFDELDSNVMCRHLGFGTVKTITGSAGYGRGVGIMHNISFHCIGNEYNIEKCATTIISVDNRCGHERDVGIECNVPDAYLGSKEELNYVIMKEDGGHMYPHIKGNSGWGIICHRNTTPTVTREVGEVICRQTHQQFLLKISRNANEPTNYEGVYYDGSISCSGTKHSLSKCNVKVSSVTSCPDGYTTIECTSALPDLVLDVSQLKKSLKANFPPVIQVIPMLGLQCALDEGCLGPGAWVNGNPRKLLRFDTTTWNLGLAPFKPLTPRENWQWHSCHLHYHSMEDFVHYDLLYHDTERKEAEGHKASFCLEDTKCSAGSRRHYRCPQNRQGISPNCADMYERNLDCQWVDITGLRDDEYTLRLSVNPNQLGLESDYRNNEAFCRIGIFNDIVDVHECWLSDH